MLFHLIFILYGPKKAKKSCKVKNSSDFINGRIIELHLQGKSSQDIAKQFGLSRQTIYRKIQKFNTFGVIQRKPGSGRPRKTSDRDDRKIIHDVLQDHFITNHHLFSDMPGVGGSGGELVKDINLRI